MRATFPIILMAALAAGGASRTEASKTRSLYEVTRELRDLRDPQVPNKTIKTYVEALQFPSDGEGEVKPILECHTCAPDVVSLEVSAELGSTGIGPSDLASQGRIIGKVRHVDWNPFHGQHELKLNWHGQAAYLWVAGKPDQNGVYDAAIVRITNSGKRTAIVNGALWFCSHPGASHPPGKARWHPMDECRRPMPRGVVKPLNFHLTSWFACDQGCCVFQDN